jgi:hypothetical protein
VTWQEAIATIVVLLGLGAGVVLFAQRPSFWIEFGVRLGQRLWPVITKRMSPEKEKELHDCIRRGGEWDNFRKKCRDRK